MTGDVWCIVNLCIGSVCNMNENASCLLLLYEHLVFRTHFRMNVCNSLAITNYFEFVFYYYLILFPG